MLTDLNRDKKQRSSKIILDKEGLKKLAFDLASSVENPFFISLNGPLGAGKTFFSSHFLKALCVENVSSPTYTILNRYSSSKGIVFHIDAYRIKSMQDLESIGYFEYVGKDSMIVEWSENIENFLPKRRIDISLEYFKDKRRVNVHTSF